MAPEEGLNDEQRADGSDIVEVSPKLKQKQPPKSFKRDKKQEKAAGVERSQDDEQYLLLGGG